MNGTSARIGRTGTALLTGVSLVVAGLAAVVGLAGPAQAAVAIALSASSGTVGVTQTISASVSSSAIGAPAGTIAFTVNGATIGTAEVGGSAGSSAQLPWTPASAGSAVLQATFTSADGTDPSQPTDTRTVQIATVNTVSTVTTPGTAATSSVVSLGATVRARTGQYVPTGTVTFLLSNGSVIGASVLDGTGRATLRYTTPSATGTVFIYVAYGGDANASPSQSATDSIKVTTQASTVALTVPQTNYVNSAVPLTAKITPATATGTVDFSVNGKYLGTGKVANGVATLTWVPSALGTFTLTAKYSGGGSVNGGSASNQVQVVQQLKPDQITVDPAGSPAAWVPGGAVTLANGDAVTLNVSSASGQTVRLAISGPCSLVANALKVNGVGGPCTLTASTNGGNGFSPTTQKYTVQTVAGTQTATVTAPASGTYGRGSTLNLSKVKAKTNLGQPVKWKVTSGAKRCSIIVKGSYYKLKLTKAGTCKVKGSAPAISDQWRAYSTTRTYTIR